MMSTFQISKSTEMEKMIAAFVEAETKHLDQVHSFIDSQLSLFEKQRQNFETDLTDAKSSGDLILGEIKVLREDITKKVGEGLSGLNAAAETISQGIVDAMVDFQQQVAPARETTDIDSRLLLADWSQSQERLRLDSAAFIWSNG
jgi:hypothetical protein